MPDRLEKPIPSCARDHGQEWPTKKKSEYAGANYPTHANNTVTCHICGRNYTIHSIDIHLPQCEKLWNDRQAKLPVKR
jgi:hypothetical protein